MKLKIKIAGPKVHDVGYRVFLLTGAMNLALPGFSAYNWTEGGVQQVIALAEGDEARMAAFRQYIEANKPAMAEVSDTIISEYDGDVGHTGEYAMMCSFVQLNKAIPLLLDIRDDLKVVKMNTNMIPQIAENTKPVPQILEEITGLREDMTSQHEDIRAIKKRIGLR